MPVGVHRAAHLRRRRRSRSRACRGLARSAAGADARRSASTSAPALAADLDDEAVAAVVEQLGEREVEAARSPAGPVPIETQKQVPPAWPQLTATMNAPSRRAA